MGPTWKSEKSPLPVLVSERRSSHFTKSPVSSTSRASPSHENSTSWTSTGPQQICGHALNTGCTDNHDGADKISSIFLLLRFALEGSHSMKSVEGRYKVGTSADHTLSCIMSAEFADRVAEPMLHHRQCKEIREEGQLDSTHIRSLGSADV